MHTRTPLLAIFLVSLAACGGGNSDTGPTPPLPPPPVGETDPPLSRKIDPGQARLERSASCEDLRAYVIDAIVEQALNPSWCFECVLSIGVPDLALAPSTGSPAPVPTQVSGTNVQVAGVDEADIVKTDSAGNVYIAFRDYLTIADAFPPSQMSVLARLQFSNTLRGLFLDEDRHRAVLLQYGMPDPLHTGSGNMPYPNYGLVAVFLDVSDPAAPVITSRLWIRGGLQTERRIDNRVHLVVNDWLQFPYALYDSPAFAEAVAGYQQAKAADDDAAAALFEAEARAIVADAVAQMDIEQFAPATRVSTAAGIWQAGPALPCAQVHRPDVSVSLGIASVVSFDTDGSDVAATGAVISPSEIYASADNLYLVQSSHNWWWNPAQASETAIHQFSLTSGSGEYVASGLVDGQVLNRFSLSEHNGHLRVATTETQWNAATLQTERSNSLFVLAHDGGGTLAVTGKVRGFGPDESIFSARFLGDRGFVVTFRQIDPLFAFDLSDPAAPRLEGELEIPGFSTYMHPYDENHLLTIGRNGDATGVDNRIRLQLFDVSNLDDPRLLHAHVPGFGDIEADASWSPASYDPHAFTFLDAQNLLSIPASMVDSVRHESFNGFLAFDVSVQDGFTERSRVSHNDLGEAYYCGLGGPSLTTQPPPCSEFGYWGYVSPLRSVVMTGDDTWLYTMSDLGLKATQADDGDTVLSLLWLVDPG